MELTGQVGGDRRKMGGGERDDTVGCRKGEEGGDRKRRRAVGGKRWGRGWEQTGEEKKGEEPDCKI